MKKRFILILFLICILTSFSSNKLVSVRGRIQSFGNVPFNFPAIVTDNNKIIKIADGKYSKDELLLYQGRRLEITGYISKEKTDSMVEYYIDIDDIKILE